MKKLKKIEQHPFFAEWAKLVKKMGGCEQCQFPWNDGLCDCQFGRDHVLLCDEIITLAYPFISGDNPQYR